MSASVPQPNSALDLALRCADWIDAPLRWIGQTISWAFLFMMLLTGVIVFMRRVMGEGSIFLQEAVLYLHGFAFILGIALTLQRDTHVRVDVLYSRMSSRTRAWVNLTGTFIFLLPLAFSLLIFSQAYISSSWQILEGSKEVDGIHGVYLLKTLIPALAVMLILQGVSLSIRAIAHLSGK